jgi:addiction module HigA family antidote
LRARLQLTVEQAQEVGNIADVVKAEKAITEETGVTADTALRLGRYFGTTPEFWMNLQDRFELETARRTVGKKLDKIEVRETACA